MIKRKYQNSSWYLCGNSDDLTPNIYKAEYEIEHLKNDVILDKSTMIILPEGMCDFLPFFNDASKMIAWLSINNMHGFDRSNTCRDLIDKKSLRLLDCSHAAQAPWIQKVLSSWGAKSFLLGDYINKSYFNASPVTSKENCIAYYPSKGRHLGEFFAQNNPMYKYIRLQNLNSFGMLWALDTSKVYIDFGHFPGKDRIPREALLRGCIIFIHNQGCATDYESFPVDDYFRFSDTDVIDGTLEAKIRNALDNYEDLYAKQELILNSVKQEYFSFSKQVSQIFGSPKRQF